MKSLRRFMMKYTESTLKKIERLLQEAGYTVRYEKGNFKAGYCVLKAQKIVVLSRFFSLEGKITALTDMLKSIETNV